MSLNLRSCRNVTGEGLTLVESGKFQVPPQNTLGDIITNTPLYAHKHPTLCTQTPHFVHIYL